MMTPTPPSATSSYSGNTPDQFRVVRKRNRIPLSCGPCRHRKLKCNRQSPCDNCLKRGDGPTCTYAAPTAKRKANQSQSAGNTTPGDMQNRIDRLEGLVLSLMTNGSQAAGPTAASQALSAGSDIGSGSLGPSLDTTLDESQMMDGDMEIQEDESETDGVTKSFGILKVDAENKKSFYIGEAHWAALLSEIGEVKNHFIAHKKEYEAQIEKVAQTRRTVGSDVGSGPALLFGASIPPPRSEILSQLPSRYMSDILVGRYFNSYDPATHILHGPSFQRQYQQHWANPSETSIVWIAMLFAIMRLAMISYAREGDEPPEFRGKCQDMAATFRTQMAHCLITADYTKPHTFIIETLIFHLHAEHGSNRDSEASVWVLVGMIVRLAMRMGYHRDSKLFPNVSPYEGEMRRRVWTFVRTADLLFSFQIALPTMIRMGDSDAELPRNLYDDEFDEDSTSLPPSRPPNEATPVSYMIAKGRLAFGFGRVLEEINGVTRKGYDEVLKIDRALRDIYDDVPEHLRLRPMDEQQLAPLALIVARFGLAAIYHKSLCVLHRRFVRLGRASNKYMYSRRTCLDSAMQLLEFQAIQHQQSQERGRLRNLRNHVSSLSTHDYLFAGTMVCMDLYTQRERTENDISTPASSATGSSSGSNSHGSASIGDGMYLPGLSYTKHDLVSALEQSRDIWMTSRDYSMEAYKASELLNVLISHIKTPSSPPEHTGSTIPGQRGNNDEQTAAMTLGLLQAGGVTPNSAQVAQAAQMAQQAQQQMPWEKNLMNAFLAGDQSGAQTFNNMSNDGNSGLFGAGNGMFPPTIFGSGGTGGNSINIDWEAWDQYMQPSLSLDPAASLWPSNSPNSNNLFAQSTTSPDQGPNPTNNSAFGLNSSFFSPNSGYAELPTKSDGPGNNENGVINGPGVDGDQQGVGGDTFMGVSTPQPGGIGMGGWKWTVMDGNR